MLRVGIERLILIRFYKHVVCGYGIMNTNKSHYFKMKRNIKEGLS
jgi:hypothetical protein